MSSVIFSIIRNYAYIDYLASQLKMFSEIPVCSGGDSKLGDKTIDRILGIGIQDLLMNLISCHGFLKNINSVVVLHSKIVNTFGK